MPKPRTLIPRNMAHKLFMIIVIIYFSNYVDNLIYMRGMIMRDMRHTHTYAIIEVLSGTT